MATGFIYKDQFLGHDTGPGHPERPDRLRAVAKRLRDDHLWEQLLHVPHEAAVSETIARVHDRHYMDRVAAACRDGVPFMDVADSVICPRSHDIARIAVGGAVASVDAVMAGQVRNAFCAVRPPGHHAEHDRSMGFCLFNNIAIAAQHLIDRHVIDRVAIVDMDVHHGNGTQHTFEERDDVLFISLHEHPSYLYPRTGFASEVGRGAGEGLTVNLPMKPYSGDDEYHRAFDTQVIPKLDAFKPDFLLVSAGFDAAETDPLGHLNVTTTGFRWMANQLISSADRYCNGRLVCTLEGGYDLQALSAGVATFIDALLMDT